MITHKIRKWWPLFWMRFAGRSVFGKIATWLATWLAPPYKFRHGFAKMSKNGYISPKSYVNRKKNCRLGQHIFIDDGVIIQQRNNAGEVNIGDEVYLNRDVIIEVGQGGSISIGQGTTVQPRSQFSAYVGSIVIGANVQIAPQCFFYPYDHGIVPEKTIKEQALISRGGIVIEDDAWLGVGVVVLDGVRIGKGAIIGAGSIVKNDVPDGAIAVGVPARVIKTRFD